MITHYKSMNPDLLCMVDTRLDNNKARMFENEFDSYKWFFAPGLEINGSLSRGVAVGIRKNSLISPGEGKIVSPGNALKVNFLFEGHEFVFFGIYGPSDTDNPMFFESIFNECSTCTERYKIMGGDFNVPLNQGRDTYNYVTDARKRAREHINDKMVEIGMRDIYRAKMGNRELFTWHNAAGTKRSRIDYFLASSNILHAVKSIGKGIFFHSDHRSIFMTLDFSNIKCGKKRWRYAPHMRQDNDLKDAVNKELRESLFRYVRQDSALGPISRNQFFNTRTQDLEQFEYTIRWGELLNVTINDARNIIISREAGRRQINRREMHDLRQAILDLEDEQPRNEPQLLVLKDRYEELINEQTIRTLTDRQEAFKIDGERPTEFFLNLEKNIVSENYIPRLKDGDNWITDQGQIEECIRAYYADLYENKDDRRTGISIEEYIRPEGIEIAPRLSDMQRNSLEGEISLEEIWEVLKKTKDKSAPGLTGITYTFFKDYWGVFGFILTKCFNEAFALGRIPDFMSRGVISLLPKGKKDRSYLKNWRPITLLECAYKLLSGVLAARLNSVINSLIDPAQKGFVPDRNIAENSRTFYDILDYAKR